MNPFPKIRAALKIRLSNLILAILLLFLSVHGQAQDELSLATPSKEGVTDGSLVGLRVNAFPLSNGDLGKIKLVFENPSRERVFVKLINDSNTVIYEEYTRLPAYNRNFNFTSCKAGIYTLTVQGVTQSYSRHIAVKYHSTIPVLELHQPTAPVPLISKRN
jgi:hypothetical protein